MRIALAGGTGFTGRRVAARLEAKGHVLRCLVRAGSNRATLPSGAQAIVGDLGNLVSLEQWLAGSEALVYCASMGFGHVPGVVESAQRAGVSRALFVSTTAIFTRLPARSKDGRKKAEESVRASRLLWTIVRPTMIYGAPGDRNMERLLRSLVKWPLVIVPGDGQALIQPVHVDDLADAIASSLESRKACGKVYNLSGAAPLTLNTAIATAADAVSRRRLRVHLPLGVLASMLRVAECMRLPLTVKSEQVLRLAEDKAFAHDDASRDLGFSPRSFGAGIVEEARILGLRP